MQRHFSPCGLPTSAYAGIPDSAKEKPDRESASTLNPDPNLNRLVKGGDVG